MANKLIPSGCTPEKKKIPKMAADEVSVAQGCRCGGHDSLALHLAVAERDSSVPRAVAWVVCVCATLT